jgi:branched-chain amino acid transport system permease protein
MPCASPYRTDLLIAAGTFLVLALAPLLEPSSYALGQATLYLIWAAVVTQWNLVLGVAGIMSIGHLALFATGGYVVALLGLYLGLSPWLSLPLSGVAAMVVSLIMGLATLRLRGAYTVVVTLSIAMVMYQLIVSDVSCFYKTSTVCYSFTGGARGLARFGDFGFAKLVGYRHVASAQYILTVALLAISTLFSIIIVHSPYGRAFQAMRDNETAARARGIDIRKFQLVVFAAAGFFTGLAGGVYAGTQRTFGPQSLELPTLLFLLSMMIVGGRGKVWGPILGTVCLAIVSESFASMAQWKNTSFAVVLILILILMPDGVAGRLERTWVRLRGVAGTNPETAR